METTGNLDEIVSIELEDAAKLFFKNRTACFIDYSKGFSNPFGTGTFVVIDGRPYVFSAYHVWKDAQTFGDCRIVSFVVAEKNGDNIKKEWWTPGPRDFLLLNSIDGIEVDMMAVKLPSYVLEKYPEIFAQEELIDFEHVTSPDISYHVAGYPNEFYRRGENTVLKPSRITMMAYGSFIVEGDKWMPSYKKDYHLQLEYPEQMATYRQGVLAAPDPKGMSGGGIWKMVKTGTEIWAAEKKCKLIGIQFEWLEGQRILVGSKIKCLVNALKLMHKEGG